MHASARMPPSPPGDDRARRAEVADRRDPQPAVGGAGDDEPDRIDRDRVERRLRQHAARDRGELRRAVFDRERHDVQRAVGGRDDDRAARAARDLGVERERAHRRAELELRELLAFADVPRDEAAGVVAGEEQLVGDERERAHRRLDVERARLAAAVEQPDRRDVNARGRAASGRHVAPAGDRERRCGRPRSRRASRATGRRASRRRLQLAVARAQRGERLHARLPLALRDRSGELAEQRRDRARELDVLEREIAHRFDEPALRDARRQRALRSRRALGDRIAGAMRPGGNPNTTTRAKWRSADRSANGSVPTVAVGLRGGVHPPGHGRGRWRSQNSRTANSRTSRSVESISHASRSAPPT